ncbi:hypothetical protein BJQ93_04164 [Bacillus subtilis]|nr:hypothetical protein [Bacillus subtilis]
MKIVNYDLTNCNVYQNVFLEDNLVLKVATCMNSPCFLIFHTLWNAI